MLSYLEFVENPMMRKKTSINRFLFEIQTLIVSPNVNSCITCFISPTWGWFDAECVDTWKLPGTRLILNEALIRQPRPLFSGVFNVLSINPTSCRPRSSWISIPTSKYKDVL
jgi:hypothetical protein